MHLHAALWCFNMNVFIHFKKSYLLILLVIARNISDHFSGAPSNMVAVQALSLIMTLSTWNRTWSSLLKRKAIEAGNPATISKRNKFQQCLALSELFYFESLFGGP